MSQHTASGSLTEVKIDKPRRHTQGPAELQVSRIAKISSQSSPEFYETQKSRYGGKVRSDFVYVNSAYVGSVDSVRDRRPSQPPTSVIREQYWACSKWPFGQRVLAVAVGFLLGAVISLLITVVLRARDEDIIPGFLMRGTAQD